MHIRNLALDRLSAAPRLDLVPDPSRHEATWQELLDTFRSLGQAAAVCDAPGHVRGMTPALAALLAGEPGLDALDAAIRAAADRARHAGALVELTVAGVRAEYALRACRHGDRASGRTATVVLVHQLRPLLPAPSELVTRFGLTAAQSRVAVLLAGGATNAAIATDLGISPHTAKRHTERVLQQLGISSRTRVLGALMGYAPAAGTAAGPPTP